MDLYRRAASPQFPQTALLDKDLGCSLEKSVTNARSKALAY